MLEIQKSDITFIVDKNTNCVKGLAGGIEALKQRIDFIMNTERYVYPIFSNNFGFQKKDLIGHDKDFIKALFEKRTEDALYDSRITMLSNFEYTDDEKDESISFDIENIFNKLSYEVEL